MSAAVIIAGGGTGGHLVPAAVLAQACMARGYRALVVCGDRPIESRVLAGFEVERRVLKLHGVATGSWLRRGAGLALLPLACLRALFWMLSIRPAFVVLIGGYVAFPVGVAAVLTGRRLHLVEGNALPGRVTRLLARFARTLVVLDANLDVPGRAQRLVGAPVRAEIRALRAHPPADDGYVLVVGGSQGAAALNETLPPLLARHALKVLHISGPGRDQEVRAAYADAGVEAKVVAYVDDMATAYAGARFAVARAGAATVAELIAAALPAVLVPYPHAADDHQRANAQVFVRLGGGRCVTEGEGFAERLDAALRALEDPGVRAGCRSQLLATTVEFDPVAIVSRLEAA